MIICALRESLPSLQNLTATSSADQKVALLGAMQSLFEGSMYTFVFLWTPALSPKGEHLPHGRATLLVEPILRPFKEVSHRLH